MRGGDDIEVVRPQGPVPLADGEELAIASGHAGRCDRLCGTGCWRRPCKVMCKTIEVRNGVRRCTGYEEVVSQDREKEVLVREQEAGEDTRLMRACYKHLGSC